MLTAHSTPNACRCGTALLVPYQRRDVAGCPNWIPNAAAAAQLDATIASTGMPRTYPSAIDSPEADQFGALDCSGFVRMVFGYRFPIPLTLAPDGDALPRRAAQTLDSAPGVVVIANTGRRPSSRTALQPGDLLFFDGSTDDGIAVDHVGVFLGRDSNGDARFVSSRKTVDGPTFGDVGGRSVLTGTGYYALAFRAARRL